MSASSKSSNPISAIRLPVAWIARSAPMVLRLLAAKIAVGGSGRQSSSLVAFSAAVTSCGPSLTSSSSTPMPAAFIVSA